MSTMIFNMHLTYLKQKRVPRDAFFKALYGFKKFEFK